MVWDICICDSLETTCLLEYRCDFHHGIALGTDIYSKQSNRREGSMRIVFALLTLAVGLAMLVGGYRLARFVIPLWGFVAGLSVGGGIIADMQNTPFLGTLLGVFVGAFLGIIFGALAYLYYTLAVLVMAGAAGYWMGSSFILLFGLDPGVLSVIVGSVLGIIFGVIALVLNAPKYVLIAFTGFAGAMAAVGGILLLFNQISLENFSYAAVNQSLSNSFIWTMLALVMAIAGIAFQARTTSNYNFETWAMDGEDHGSHTFPTQPTHPTGAH